MSAEKEKVRIAVPWPGPNNDEWDSGGYNDFWGTTERVVNQRILDAKAEGKEVELIAPDDFHK